MRTALGPPLPDAVAAAFARHPAAVADRLLAVRGMIFAVAGETPGVGLLTETLKWGEPAYRAAATRSGSTIRLGVTRAWPDRGALLVHCRTSLIETARRQFGDVLQFEGRRAVLLPASGPLPEQALAFCIVAALTYRRRQPEAHIKAAPEPGIAPRRFEKR